MASEPREQAELPASVQSRVPAAVAELPEAPEREAAHSEQPLFFWERRYVVFPLVPAQPQPGQLQVRQTGVPVARRKPFFRKQLWFRLKTAWNTPPTGQKGKAQSKFYLSTV